MDVPTMDPSVVIEEQRVGYVRYRNPLTGRRWEVHGVCDQRGDCLEGAVWDWRAAWLDCPVTPELDSCCGDPVTGVFGYVELGGPHGH